MFTLTYGMHSLFDAPKPEMIPKEHQPFKGVRQVLEESGKVNFHFGHRVTKIELDTRPALSRKRMQLTTCSHGNFSGYDIVLVTLPPLYLKRKIPSRDFNSILIQKILSSPPSSSARKWFSLMTTQEREMPSGWIPTTIRVGSDQSSRWICRCLE